MRQHVNPLSRFFQVPIDLPVVEELFLVRDNPLHLDIGSARGKFLISMAQAHPDWNFLGVEIRNSLVIAAEREREELGFENLKFLFCNANVSLNNWLLKLPNPLLNRVSIQFPDPCFKRRHFKRRVLQPDLLFAICNSLNNGGELFIQSDLLEVIEPMISLIESTNCFDPKGNNLLIQDNPFNITTERESYALKKRKAIYRKLFTRNSAILRHQ